MTLRTLIVDDEPLARRRIARLLRREPDVTIVAECATAESARAALEEQAPNLVFLDVQMPGHDGIWLLDAIEADASRPAIVFVTAHEQYTLKAFDAHAVDYLLKPYDDDRFALAVARARERLGTASIPNAPVEAIHRFAVRVQGRISFVPVASVDWIEADGKYVRIHAGGASHLVRAAIGALEERLDPAVFLRIHRGAIVRVAAIRELYSSFSGDYAVVLQDGTRLTLSRRYRAQFENVPGF